MSAESKQESKMETDSPTDPLEEPIDEYVESFESLENGDTLNAKIEDYLALLVNPRFDEKAVKVKEQCIYRLARLYTESKRLADVMGLLKSNSNFFSLIPKAKTAKIVRSILNIVGSVPDSLDTQVGLCKDIIEWCVAEKRTFLRQRIEAKLCSLLLQQEQPTQALELIDKLLPELKKLDDKQMLTETHLTEARIYHSLKNIPKAKASLTASRSAANAIYVTPLLQAEIDEMSGCLHCEEGDYVTAYSYFQEAFDGYDQTGTTAAAVSSLKYMVLCRVLGERASEGSALLSSKMGLKHAGADLDAMAAIAQAAKKRSLDDFTAATKKFDAFLHHDALIAHHLELLYDKMLESNLLKIIHPYSSVDLAHVAKNINLPEAQVVHKLSQMILDRKFHGILDQGRGHLIIYDTAGEDSNFTKAVEVIGNMQGVVEALHGRARGLAKAQALTTSSTSASGSADGVAASPSKASASKASKETGKDKK